jgi:hypothetical protein
MPNSNDPRLKARYSFPVNAVLTFEGVGSIRTSRN